MIAKIKVPKLDANIEEVTVTAWFRKEGEPVRKGEPLAEFTTEKASIEYESPCAGVLRRIVAAPKSVVPVGFVIALVGSLSDALPDVSRQNEKLLAARRPVTKAPPKPPPSPNDPTRARVRATPAARRLARELDIDLARVCSETGSDVVTESAIRAWRENKRS